MEMLYSFWSDKILVGILKKVCCNNAVVSNILNVFFACFLLFSTLTVMNVHSIIKLLSHWKVTFGFELFYCMRNYSGVNSLVKFYIIHFSMISNVCWHQIKFFQAIDVIKYVVKRYWCKTLLWNVIDHLPLQVWSREPPAGGLPSWSSGRRSLLSPSFGKLAQTFLGPGCLELSAARGQVLVTPVALEGPVLLLFCPCGVFLYSFPWPCWQRCCETAPELGECWDWSWLGASSPEPEPGP